MRLRKFIPIFSACSIGVVIAPTVLTSCNKYTNVDLLKGFTPKNAPKAATKFASINEANKYYAQLPKQYFIEDYIGCRAEYIKEGLEYPTPLLPYRFVNIDSASIAVENGGTDFDASKPEYFLNSFEIVYKVSGQTKVREEPKVKSLMSNSAYINDSYVSIEMTIKASKLPCTLATDRVDNGNESFLYGFVEPVNKAILSELDYGQVAAMCNVSYSKQNSYDETISAVESIRCHGYKDYGYDEQRDAQKSYCYALMYTTMTFDSYHLQNCVM